MKNFITFKGHKISRTQVYNNLKKIYDQSSDDDKRQNWYKDAYKVGVKMSIHLKYPLCESISKSCGVIAALSPIKSWDENKEIAEKFILTGHGKHTGVFIKKAWDILDSDGSDEAILKILNGRKISSFYDNIKNYKTSNRVTIDRHALSCIFGKWSTDDFYKGMTKNQYNWFESAFQYASEKIGIQPLELQAVTWVTWRRIKTNYKRINKLGVEITDHQKSLVNQVPENIVVPF